MNKDIIFLGIQWCGKWTQGKMLLKELNNYEYLEMGQLFRAIMSNDNIIGNFCKDIVNSGGLVDHFVSLDWFHTALQIAKKKGKGLMIDGFPRAKEQAEGLIKRMEEYGREYLVIHYKLSKEKAIERILKRAEIEGRKDDTPEAIEVRIQAFINETQPVIDEFEALGKVITIDADGSIEEIFENTKKALGL